MVSHNTVRNFYMVSAMSEEASKESKMAALKLFQQAAMVGTQQELDEDQLENINQSNQLNPNFDVVMGLRYTAAGPNGVKTRVEVTADHLQPWGITHGGLYAAIGESAGSVASYLAAGAGPAVMGTSNHTDFLRPSTKGDVIVTTATPEHIGRTSQLWRIEHRNEATGKLVALTQLKTVVVPDSQPQL